jgi:uncharacterized protein YjbI with pentapeptide repeats
MNVSDLEKLYNKYGFETQKIDSDIAVFGIQQGRYYGVDIIPLSVNANIDKIENEYKSMGYGVKTFGQTTYKEIDSSLFESFFSYDSTTAVLQSRYEDYIYTRADKLGIDYEYIPCPYAIIGEERSSADLDQSILDALSQDGPQLVILEAAASFGKTATSYQILNRILTSGVKKTPLFSELYKNRQARIFSHILLYEKEHLFPHLKAELVVEEIKNGRVPVIIDGFDELLLKSKVDNSKPEDFEEIGSMLATIGELLEGNAKILLTTRKTAIFAGDDFYEWLSNNSSNFTITRYEIHKPSIQRWIGHEKFKVLEHCGIPISSISSPVLLSHIKSMDEDLFKDKCETVDQLISDFFDKILNREQDRQDLTLNNESQMQILRDLAGVFAYLGITSEHKSFVSDMILERHHEELMEALKNYPLTKRPTMDELVEKLSNHALLDRIGSKDDHIGFINDFVFGYLISEKALEKDDKWLIDVYSNERFAALSTSAFGLLKNENSELLLAQVEGILPNLPTISRILIEKNLKSKITEKYEWYTFDKLDFSNLTIDEKKCFNGCVFNECRFENVVLHKRAFSQVSFTGCSFTSCTAVSDGNGDTGAWFFGNEEFRCSIESHLQISKQKEAPLEINEDSFFEFEKEVLRNIFPKGRPNAAIKRPVRTLFRGIRPDQKRYVPSAIKSLEKMGFITIEDNYAYVAKDRMAEITSFLGD